ncbi:hypothetical protein Bca101_075769 [Brassica carinata]
MPVHLLVQQPGREHLPFLQLNPRRGHSTWLVFFFICTVIFFALINLLTCIFFLKVQQPGRENATILAELASQKKFNTEIMQKLDRLMSSSSS